MVNTKSQSRNNSVDMSGIDRHSGIVTYQINEFGKCNLLNYRNETEMHAVKQHFSEMSKQISDLTNLVLALTEKLSSSTGEGNELYTVSNGYETRSDIVHTIDYQNFHRNFPPESAPACASASKSYE